MRKMKLITGEDFYNRCEVSVYDITEEKEKRRCKVTVEYSAADVRQLRSQGIEDLDAALEHYRDWIYDIVKYYITDDWECAEGMDEVTDIIAEHIREYFEEGEKR